MDFILAALALAQLCAIAYVAHLLRGQRPWPVDEDGPIGLTDCIGQEGSDQIEDDVEDYACEPSYRQRKRIGFYVRRGPSAKSRSHGRIKA
jgi:hypothetical protein